MLLKNKSINFKNYFYIFLFLITLLRVITASSFDFGVDEAHYALYGINLDLSYFDHPPLVGWTQYIFYLIFGNSVLTFRIAAIISSVVVSFFIFNIIKNKFQSEEIAFYSVLALNSSFVIAALFLMFLPENLLFIIVFPIIFYTIKITNENSLKNYLLLGLFLGIAGLSKYTAILFIPPILLFILLKKRIDLFLTYKFLILILISFIIIIPVIIWNINNDWISFSYQSSHVMGSNTINFKSISKNLISQLLAFSPFLSFVAFYGLYKAIKSKDDLLLLISLIGSFIFLFFVYSSFYKNTLPHWNSLFYILLIPIGIAFLFKEKEKLTKILILISLCITIFLHLELTFKFTPMKDYKSVHRDIYGWPEIISKASEYGKNLAVTNWTVASRALYYSTKKDINLFLIDKRYDQFDIWQKENPISKDLVFINTHFFKKDIQNYVYCDEYKNLTDFDILLNNKKVNTVNLILCKNYKGIK